MTTDKPCDHINAQQQVRTLCRGTGIISDQRHKPYLLTECVVTTKTIIQIACCEQMLGLMRSMTTSEIDRLVTHTRDTASTETREPFSFSKQHKMILTLMTLTAECLVLPR